MTFQWYWWMTRKLSRARSTFFHFHTVHVFCILFSVENPHDTEPDFSYSPLSTKKICPKVNPNASMEPSDLWFLPAIFFILTFYLIAIWPTVSAGHFRSSRHHRSVDLFFWHRSNCRRFFAHLSADNPTELSHICIIILSSPRSL